MKTNEPHSTLAERRSRGFTLVEVLIVVVVIGVLATVVVFAVRGVANQGDAVGCGTDARVLSTAAEVYLADRSMDHIPPTGIGANRFERTLVAEGFLDEVSGYYVLDTNGGVSADGEPCA